ncbi:MAG: hypothetical protein ACH36H_11365 [Candidatus Nanopelagicales bacterium]
MKRVPETRSAAVRTSRRSGSDPSPGRPRWRAWAAGVVVLGGALAGCSQGQPTSASSAQFTTGAASADLAAHGQTYGPCTGLEAEGYPGDLTRPSSLYYQGPWCATVNGSTVYLWAFARTPQAQLTDAELANQVNLDVDQMRLDLLAQGYDRVCGRVAADGDIDEGFERSGAPLAIRVISSGEPQARPTAVASAGVVVPSPVPATDPLSLRVVLSPSTRRPAVAEDGSAPPC